MAELAYEIIQNIACLSQEYRGWTKELNLISWNGNKPKYDIRAWSADHKQMGKGITLTKEELTALRDVLNELI
ncbi:MAG TPA: PC4/YdbC family ssDNA-binding protein [Clostridia bacterium]|nr:PC4/YdbC family ssDNA-binding protein [Clostridia bacterium]